MEKDNKILDKDKLIKKIVSFFKSEKVILIIVELLLGYSMKSKYCGTLLSILLNNPKDKFYYFEILFSVLEPLKEKKFDEYLKKFGEDLFKEKKDGELHQKYQEYSKKTNYKKEIIFIKRFENSKNYGIKLIKENAPFIVDLAKYSFLAQNIGSYLGLYKSFEKYIEKNGKEEGKSLII